MTASHTSRAGAGGPAGLAQHRQRRRALWAASIAHATHDGMTDLVYVLLPLWQSQFALSYAAAGLMRAAYSGVMAAFQMQASQWARRLVLKNVLVVGTAVSGPIPTRRPTGFHFHLEGHAQSSSFTAAIPQLCSRGLSPSGTRKTMAQRRWVASACNCTALCLSS